MQILRDIITLGVVIIVTETPSSDSVFLNLYHCSLIAYYTEIESSLLIFVF